MSQNGYGTHRDLAAVQPGSISGRLGGSKNEPRLHDPRGSLSHPRFPKPESLPWDTCVMPVGLDSTLSQPIPGKKSSPTSLPLCATLLSKATLLRTPWGSNSLPLRATLSWNCSSATLLRKSRIERELQNSLTHLGSKIAKIFPHGRMRFKDFRVSDSNRLLVDSPPFPNGSNSGRTNQNRLARHLR